MLWVYLTILAIILWSILNIIDKYLVINYLKNPSVAIVFLSIIGLFSAFLILPFGIVTIPPLTVLVLSIIGGIFYTLGNLLYYHSLSKEEVSRVITLWSLTPIFVLIISTIFLGEIFTPIKYLGIILVILGSILISLRKDVKFYLSTALALMIISSLLLAINYVIIKYATNFIDYWDAFFWIRIGSGLMIPVLLALYYKPLKETLTAHPKSGILMTLNEGLNVIGIVLITIAISFGFVSLVTTLNSTQPIFIFFFAVLLSVFMPKILKEELKGSILSLKLLAIIITIIGAILII